MSPSDQPSSLPHSIHSYWDWAEKRVETEGVPGVLIDETVDILLPPFGDYHNIENPIAWFPINTIPSFPADFVDEIVNVSGHERFFTVDAL